MNEYIGRTHNNAIAAYVTCNNDVEGAVETLITNINLTSEKIFVVGGLAIVILEQECVVNGQSVNRGTLYQVLQFARNMNGFYFEISNTKKLEWRGDSLFVDNQKIDSAGAETLLEMLKG